MAAVAPPAWRTGLRSGIVARLASVGARAKPDAAGSGPPVPRSVAGGAAALVHALQRHPLRRGESPNSSPTRDFGQFSRFGPFVAPQAPTGRTAAGSWQGCWAEACRCPISAIFWPQLPRLRPISATVFGGKRGRNRLLCPHSRAGRGDIRHLSRFSGKCRVFAALQTRASVNPSCSPMGCATSA